MVEALSSGLEAPSTYLYNGFAEAAPEPALTVAPDSTRNKPPVDLGRVCYCVLLGHMCLELFTTVAGFTTDFAGVESARLVALPQLKLAMLTVLVSFPVILATKSLSAMGVSAAVRLFVSFLMLLEFTRPGKDFATVWLVADYLTTVTGSTGN